MKKLKALLFAAFLIISGSTFAQTAQQATPAQSTTKKADKAKTTAKAEGQKLKADGTPDKRYNENKNLKKDGTPDKRFKTAKADSLKTSKKKN